MTNFSTRIRLIFYPFLIVAICFIGIYTFLDWLFVIRLEMPLSEDLVHYWLAVSLPIIPVLIWLRPRIKLLILKDKKGNLPFLYQFVAMIAIAIPTVITQDYLVTATGRLTVLQNIDQIKRPLTKYYGLKKYFIDKQHIAVYQRMATSGKNNEYLDFYIDVACPVLADTLKPDSSLVLNLPDGKKPVLVIDGILFKSGSMIQNIKRADIKSMVVLTGKAATAIYGSKAADGAILITTKSGIPGNSDFLQAHVPKAWLCLQFSKSMSNNLSRDEKDKAFREFDSVTNIEFKEKNLGEFVYLDRIPVNDRRKAYLKAIQRKIDTVKKPVIFETVNEPFEARSGNKLEWIFRSFGIGAAIWLLMIVIPKLNTLEIEKVPQNSLQNSLEAIYKFLSVFKAGSKFQITAIIIGLNLLVFIIMVFAGLGFISFDSRDLLNWGGDYRPLTMGGQWWRLLTSIFVHGGLMHVLMNMYGLFFVAIFLEPLLGKLRYASAYLVCGVVASIASISWHPTTVGIGASGAIFGLYGVLLALLSTNKVDIPAKKGLLIFSLVFIVINLVSGLGGNIDNAAHIGGLLCGLMIGYYFFFFTNLPEKVEKSEETSNTADRVDDGTTG